MTSLNMPKLKEMIHYIASTIPEEKLGKTKLNKILWFSDREAYLKLGHTISGGTYIRMPRGPVADSLNAALFSLEADGILTTISEYHGEYSKYTFHSLTQPECKCISNEETQILDSQIKRLADLTAKEVSELSHDYTWDLYENGEPIDMVAVLARPMKPTAEDIAWAKGLV